MVADDIRLCPHGLLAIYYMLGKAEAYHPDFISLRSSFGMNGIFWHAHDIAIFANYLGTYLYYMYTYTYTHTYT